MGKKKSDKKNNKDAQLIIRISKEERKAFVDLCEEIDTTAAREIRHFIRRFISDNSDAGIRDGSREAGGES